MNLGRTGIAHHLHDLGGCGATYDRVVDEHDPFAVDNGAIGAVLQPHPELPDVLGRLDECASDIMIADNPELVWNSGSLRIPDCRGHAGIGNRYDNVCRHRRLACQLGAHSFAYVVTMAAADD